jgi:hypothetical protein
MASVWNERKASSVEHSVASVRNERKASSLEHYMHRYGMRTKLAL